MFTPRNETGNTATTTDRRGHGDRGVVIIEAAIMTPVIFLMLFAIFEFGFVFHDYLTLANTTRDGARQASISGDIADADFRTVQSMAEASAAFPDGAIDRFVVFQADGPTSTIPAACKTSTAPATLTANSCNVYTPNDFALTRSDFGCDPAANPTPDPDRFWCPTDRTAAVGAVGGYVGIWMSVNHAYITGMFGSGITFDDTTILKIEPEAQ